MKRILLTGKRGQVGWELQRTLATVGEVIALDSSELDLSDSAAVRQTIQHIKPAIIVNPAAYTAVDQAETEPELARAINAVAPGVMAEEAKKLDALLVHFSTDYVFDGRKIGAYAEQDATNPLSVYGRTKLAGEQAIQAVGGKHLIFRTSWVYGARGKNFMLTMLRLAKARSELCIVDDQFGAPTWCRSLAEITAQVLAQANHFNPVPSGIYHLSAAGQCSWFDFTAEILRMVETQPLPKLIPIPASDYPTPATRPQNSVLSNEKIIQTFGLKMPDWRHSLQLCLQEN